MPGCSPRRASASLHVGTQPGRARQSSWAAGSQLNAAGAALAPAALEHRAGGSPSPTPSSNARTALVPSQTSQSLGMLGSQSRSRQSPPADGGGGDAGTELPISTLYLLQGPLAVTFKRQGGLAARELAAGRRHSQ